MLSVASATGQLFSSVCRNVSSCMQGSLSGLETPTMAEATGASPCCSSSSARSCMAIERHPLAGAQCRPHMMGVRTAPHEMSGVLQLCLDKKLTSAEDLRAAAEQLEARPGLNLGAKLTVKAWTDPAFRVRG